MFTHKAKTKQGKNNQAINSPKLIPYLKNTTFSKYLEVSIVVSAFYKIKHTDTEKKTHSKIIQTPIESKLQNEIFSCL